MCCFYPHSWNVTFADYSSHVSTEEMNYGMSKTIELCPKDDKKIIKFAILLCDLFVKFYW